MAASTPIPVNWNKIAGTIARRLRAEYGKRFGKRKQCDLAPEVAALQSALNEFPCAIRILLVECGKEQATSLNTVICHDLSRPRTTDAEFLGVVRQESLDLVLLRESFGVDLANFYDFRPSTFFDSNWSFITDIVPYQVSDALDRYAQEFYDFLCNSFWHVIQANFCKTTDYKSKYGVPSDPILTASELLRCKQPFVNARTGAPPTLEEWQAMMSDIVLIPQVPESVKRTFETAKQLFVFSYFSYALSTTSQHYAFLALEAALQARWSATLPKDTIVEFGNGSSTKFVQPTHKDLYQHWRVNRKITVNGEKFPNSSYELLRSLLKKGIIEMWQLERMEAGIDLRNDLSHLEFAPVTGPSADVIAIVADLINAMFDSVTLGT
ncbi:MAG: hypothetical protein ACJ71W_13245 [Terriglobales bacterium]